ncbi:cytochrome P450 [Conexibacter arvalis]|uniref:Cytochrome P450 n=1 Tax=Conexibacter arvalis TaxID=912552 RepID=A0A840ICY9_9ACTN|nr:cytochrome P450 [Conexibacter arvalis]MBB4662807.1 cytochrome P450 [Conexibacter arvalis]
MTASSPAAAPQPAPSVAPDAELDPASAPLPPGPRGAELLRWMARFRTQEGPLEVLADVGRRYGDVCLFDLPRQRLVIVRGPEAVRRVLVSNQDNYRKSNQYELLEPVLGKGLVTSSGPLWQRQRKLVQPMFAKRHLAPFADHMAAAAGAALDQWEATRRDGEQVEVSAEILQIGLDTVGRALVGHDFTGRAAEFGEALANALHQAGALGRSTGVSVGQYLRGADIQKAARVTHPLRWRSGIRSAEVLTGIGRELIDERLAHGHGERDDLLKLLMEAEDEETGERMDREQVLDELMTFLAAGHETTAHGLSWMYYLLSQHPEARERMEAEVDEVLGGRVPTADDAERLPWTRACFEEAMRIFPPVWHVQRVANEDDVVCGRRIPAGALVFVSIWSTHRDPAVWPNPAGYDPRRWLGDEPRRRPRFSYLPFGGGRRICVGHGFAMLNATLLAAMIAQRFRFDFVPGSKIVLDPTVTIRPLHGIPMTIHRRERIGAVGAKA